MSRLLLNIITPCTQTENLELLHESIVTAKKNLPIDIKWHIVFHQCFDVYESQIFPELTAGAKDGITISKSYHDCDKELDNELDSSQINWALDYIDEGFIYILRENNLVHPDLFNYLYQRASNNPKAFGGMIVEQYLEDDEIRPVKPLPGFIDGAQFIINNSIIEDIRLHHVLNADGFFLQQMYNKHQERFEIITKPLAYLKKVEEYRLLEEAPSTFGIGSLVTINKDHYHNHFSKIETFMIQGTIMKLRRQLHRKMIITNIMEEVDVCLVVILPPRKSNIAWRHGKGTVLKFESREQAEKVFSLVSGNR
jgi:hypothetical protein